MENGAVVIDTREPPAFAGVHVRGSYSIWTEGLPEFAGWVLPRDKPLRIIADGLAALDAAALYLRRLDYERFGGYLEGGIESWLNASLPVEHLPLLSVHELKHRLDSSEDITMLDVRSTEEWETGHIDGARHIFVGKLESAVGEIARDIPVAVLCSVGRRSSLAASILLRAGSKQVYNVIGAMKAWKSAGYPVTR
jgi:hydroxyacylglutathione hydrolase